MQPQIPIGDTNCTAHAAPRFTLLASNARRYALGLLCLLAVGRIAVPTTGTAAEMTPFTAGEKMFALHVMPLLSEKCWACHGAEPDDLRGGLDLRSRDSTLDGGDAFGTEVLIPGDGHASFLYRCTTGTEVGYEMPPKRADALSKEQQGWIRNWIDAQAPWPDADRIATIQAELARGERVIVSKALSKAWQNRRYEPQHLWSYRPLAAVDVPDGRHPIDYWIDRRLAEARLKPAPAADGPTLVRRIYFNLTGLPPTPEQIDRFVRHHRRDPDAAVVELAERLMDSPHYGEQFARRWLDVVRYADTAGFANDYSRPHAWRYRDYVVRSFNADKPFDRFVLEQLAGDEIAPNDPEALIATGFLRMGPWEQTGMSVFKQTRGQWLDDVTDTVGQAFLAHPMQCCKCHDHKFDPVPTRDYYRLMAVFSTTQFAERQAAFLDSENREGFESSERWVQAKIDGYRRQLVELTAKIAANRRQESGDAKVGDNGLDPGDEASAARIKKNLKRHTIELDRTRPLTHSVYTGATIPRVNVVGRIEKPAGKDVWDAGEIEADVIRTGGDVHATGDPVTPGALSAAESLGGMPASDFPSGRGRRRAALARWITNRENPLTARVIVNRVWAWHFGFGIAAKANNFGATGGTPSHPELLDFLAAWFLENGGSIKKLNRLIITSRAYQRSSRHPDPAAVARQDPRGEWYAAFRPRRLSAEELRDAMLASSGELNPAVGGIPVRPDLNPEVAFQPRQIMGGTASVYEPDPTPAQRNRRTLYAQRIRGLRDPFLEVFNQPSPDKSCERREVSIIAPQALTLLNSQATLDRSVAFAIRLINRHRDNNDNTAILRTAFRIAFGRTPQAAEVTACLDHWRTTTRLESAGPRRLPGAPRPTSIRRVVMAEKTGQPYSFVERLPAFESYQDDTSLADVDARTRGLAAVCRVLFNASEFSHIE